MNIRSHVKNIFSNTWKTASVVQSFRKRHKSIYNNGEFKRIQLTKKEKNDYRKYWKAVSPMVNLETVEITKSLSGVFNKHIVPEEFYPLHFEPFFNDNKNVAFLENKSIYNKWFDEKVFPKDFFHKINNNYYTYDFDIIDNIEEFIDKKIMEFDFPMVIKPNKDSYGGANIYFVNSKDEIKNIIKQHSDLVIQEKIKQSELINNFNPNSINTIRICLYRDEKDIVHVLNSSIRMGVDGGLDNETAGGIVCNIKPTGFLNEYAVDKYAFKYFKHPNSGFVFKNKELPMYEELKLKSKEVAQKIIDTRLISLDMALDSDNNWRCIEANLFGQTIRFAQYAGEPFFGSLTEEVMNVFLSEK